MPIQEENIVFVESQVMDDVPEGGGAATGNVVVDGEMNNVFEDISDLDRAYGRFNLRKLFLAVRAVNTDLLGGAKVAVTKLPTDPAVGYALFTTGDPFDKRDEAANRVEAYLFKGTTYHGALFEAHIIGMRMISVIQRVDTDVPPIGKTLCIVQNEGDEDEKEQYVRVTSVDVEERTFEDQKGPFTRWVVRLGISDPLRYDFAGFAASRFDTYSYAAGARIRDTNVADATRYFGSKPLMQAAEIGDIAIRVDGLFTPLVPSAQTETPLVGQRPAAFQQTMVPAADGTITISQSGVYISAGNTIYAPGPVVPLSMVITMAGVQAYDNGRGELEHAGGDVLATIDYATGAVTPTTAMGNSTGTVTFQYRPAGPTTHEVHQSGINVTAENRRLNWIENLDPLPAPNSVTVSFLAQGRWYTLTDDGDGTLSGSDPSIGAGSVSYVTGDISITLGAMPDVGGQIQITWGSPVHFVARAGSDPDIPLALEIDHQLAAPFEPGSLALEWVVGGITKTATTAANGEISGDATGYAQAAIGRFILQLSEPPDPGTQIAATYDEDVVTQAEFTGLTETGGTVFIDLDSAIKPGSLELSWTTDSTIKQDKKDAVYIIRGSGSTIAAEGIWPRAEAGASSTVRRQAYTTKDDGLGVIMDTGSVNYTTGHVTLPVLPTVTQRVWESVEEQQRWVEYTAQSEHQAFTSGNVTARYIADGTTPTARAESIDVPPVTLRLLPPTADEVIVPGSVMLTWGGVRYVDRAGTMYRDVDAGNGAGTPAGSIDYNAGRVALTSYPAGVPAIQVVALLTTYGEWSTLSTIFRTALTPVKPEGFLLTATAADGDVLQGTADADGNITGDDLSGAFDYATGVASITFAKPVVPSTVSYSAVAYSYIPLDASILGIDPVRLPSDGRVPIYRPGDVVLIAHPAETAPQTVSNGQTVSTGRTRLAWVRVLDANGQTISGDTYTLDRANGTVRFDDVSGYAQPVTIRHTVADMRMVTDAEITGDLTLSRALTHPFPADESIVASCLIFGDRRARVSSTWDQQSWDGTWADYQIGNAATGTLNLIDFPIQVTNEGCDTDRWILRFTSSTAAELISEKRGLVWSGGFTPGGGDIAPINPRTRTQLENGTYVGGEPYMVIPGAANGGGWSAGNVVRINTVGAIADFWMARAIQQSDEPLDDGADCVEIYALGNIDRP